jgi:hypothetical protein
MGIVDVGGWVAPGMELIYEQGTPDFRGQWPAIESMLELAPARLGRGDWAHPALALPAVPSRRVRRDAWDTDHAEPPVPPVPAGVLHDNSTARVAALDDAGVALQLISPGPSIDACLQLPSNLAAGVFAAYNRYITAYCHAHPQRLGAVLQIHGSEPRWSAQEVAELRHEPSVRAVSLCLAVRISPDDGRFDPLWEALEQAGLPLLHRPSFCARIWTPGRLVAYLAGSGVLERFPGLRVGFVAGDSEGAADELTRRGDAGSSGDTGLASRLFAAATASQLQRGSDGATAMLWASDFPLRGSLRSELDLVRGALGARAEEVLIGAPRRFLGA